MSKKWDIKGVRNNETVTVATVHELEYHGEWMAEAYVTVTVKSPTPVDWHFDDYLEYRGELFSINYDPNVVKKARRGTYDEGFTYENIKFYFIGAKAKSYKFKDVVLSDNHVAYTSLEKFQFYAASVEDLADRLQANFDRESQSALLGHFKVLTPNSARVTQRLGSLPSVWSDYYAGNEPTGETDVNIEVDGQSCWEGLKWSYEKFGLGYYFDGEYIIIGGKPIVEQHIFRYGKGLGLYEIERTSDDNQEIITKLFAYGSEQNIPLNYYANQYKKPYVYGLKDHNNDDWNIRCTDIKWADIESAFTDENKTVIIKAGNVTCPCTASPKKYNDLVGDRLNLNFPDGLEYDINGRTVFCTPELIWPQITSSSQHIYFTYGVDTNKWPATLTDQDSDYPDLLSINKLMLPGFPAKSLDQWVKDKRDSYDPSFEEYQQWATIYNKYTFSTNASDPWIESSNLPTVGLYEGSVNFDGSQQKEIYPTIENTDSCYVVSADTVRDNGYLDDKTPDDVYNFHIYVHRGDNYLNWGECYSTAQNRSAINIEMKSGYCVGRTFKLVSKPVSMTITVSGTEVDVWDLKCERFKDTSLDRYFPYFDNDTSWYCQVLAGDTFVATGIDMPPLYIEAASEKVFIAACGYLDKRDHMRYTYLPKVDHIYMERQHDYVTNHGTGQDSVYGSVSLHDTLHAGMQFQFEDAADLGINRIGSVAPFIDQLTIKENGEDGIPTYDVVLRDEKEKGTLEKLADKISDLQNAAIPASERTSMNVTDVVYQVWDAAGRYYHEAFNTNPPSPYEGTILEQSYVYHRGKKWKCMRTLTNEEPKYGCVDWIVVEGDRNWGIEFQSSNGSSFYLGYVNTVVTARLFWGTEDVTDQIEAPHFMWSRSTESGKSAEDLIWDAMPEHQGVKQLTLTNGDMPINWSRSNKAIFTLTVTISEDVTVINNIIA